MSASMPILTIAIPTYNRGPKVKRLLGVIREQLADSAIGDQVVVLVSDNASRDDTAGFVQAFVHSDPRINYYRQTTNLGFDGNLRFLYRHTTTPYVWFIADDDLILPGALRTMISALENCRPDVLKFSFIQPPGSIFRVYDYPDPVHLLKDPVTAIEHIIGNIKVSMFVLRRVEYSNDQWYMMDGHLGNGWFHLILSFSALDASPDPCLAIISEPLATCDEEYYKIDYSPVGIARSYTAFEHPFVAKHYPELRQRAIVESYCQAIEWAFSGKIGIIAVSHPEEYDAFIEQLEWRLPTLMRRPRHLLLFLALKLHLAHFWPTIRVWMQRLRLLSVWRRLTMHRPEP